LGPGENADINIIYSPQDAGEDRGKLVIESNSRSGRITEVDIFTQDGASELVFAAQTLFGVGACEDEDREWVIFQNLGSVPVNVSRVALSLDSSPAFSLGDYKLTTDEMTQDLTTADGISIAQGSTFEVEVIYNREGDGDDQGILEIYYEGDAGNPYQMNLKGGVELPSVQTNPESVIFAPLDVGESSDIQEVFVTNIGSVALSVESVELAINDPEVNAQFTLYDITTPQELDLNQSFSFGVSYHPAVEGVHRTSIAVSFGECEGQIAIPINGRVREPCLQIVPEAVNFGRLAQGQTSAPNTLEVLNCGDTPVEISEISMGEGGQDFEWRWIDSTIALPFVIEPRMTADLEVTYTNNSLAEGQVAMTNLNVTNNTPNEPVIQVPMSVIGGGVASCEMRILPDRMNFGLVSRGRSVARELRAVNIGTGTCEIVGESIDPLIPIPLPGFDTVKFTLTNPIMSRQAAAGQFLNFEITYTPEIFNADAATYTLTYFDPFMNEERTATSALTGISGESNIEVIPSRLDFGQVTAGDCASREERVTVYNTGVVDLCIRGVALEGPGCQEFLITERPVANQDGCIIVTRNNPANVRMVYEPGNLGEDACELVFTSDAADNPELRVPLSGEGVSNSRQVDEFVQEGLT
jgi:hypothetical protein